MKRAKWQIEADARRQADANALDKRRTMHATLVRLGHNALWCADSWECAWCSASGTLEMPIPERKCGT